MGFFGDLGRSLLGAGVGLVTGGPVGAVAGGAAGFMSGSSASRTTNTSNVSTRQTQLRDWTPDEEANVNQAMQGLGLSLETMTPEQTQAARQQVYERLYGLASQGIKDTFNAREAEDYSLSASRGGANTSAGNVRSDRRDALEGRELSRASVESDMASREVEFREQQMRQMAIDSYLRSLGQMWNQRLQGSTIVQTGSGQAVAPDTFLPSVAAGLGYAVSDDESWLNTTGNDMLGGL